MAFDFPASPTNGQEYTSGGMTYVWSGYAWNAKNTLSALDYVKKAGDTMTGMLTLAALNPVGSNDATRKLYVDNEVANANANANMKVAKAGDTMSGSLTINSTTTPALAVNKPITIDFASALTNPRNGTAIANYGFSALGAVSLNGYVSETGPAWKYLGTGYMARMWLSGSTLVLDVSAASGNSNDNATAFAQAMTMAPTVTTFNTSVHSNNSFV